jgi:chemotaxis protein MotB
MIRHGQGEADHMTTRPQPAFTVSGPFRIGAIAASALALAACVPQEKYNDLELAYRSEQQQLIRTQGELETARANEARLRSQLAQAAADLDSLEALRKGQNVDVDKLLADYEALLGQIGKLDVGGPLPADVNKALEELAAQYPDVLQFDPRRGMIRFMSDFTFDPGSAQLKSSALTALKTLAPILTSSPAAGFEVVVVGHTDNTPIRRSAAQHPTNMHLSAHRAISVRDQLVKDGVPSTRFLIAGYGEFRPVVANGSNGAAQNRRVEVYLMPFLVSSGSAGVTATPAPPAPAPAAAPAAGFEEPTK